ncbi:MAG: beta-lactamase family protein [Aquincola sp.]|nr:beta-lactamase family protein [Aquincola sp.]
MAEGDDTFLSRWSRRKVLVKQGVPVAPDTRFCIASVTKPMTRVVFDGLVAEAEELVEALRSARRSQESNRSISQSALGHAVTFLHRHRDLGRFRAFVGQLLFHGMSVDEVKSWRKSSARVLGLAALRHSPDLAAGYPILEHHTLPLRQGPRGEVFADSHIASSQPYAEHPERYIPERDDAAAS